VTRVVLSPYEENRKGEERGAALCYSLRERRSASNPLAARKKRGRGGRGQKNLPSLPKEGEKKRRGAKKVSLLLIKKGGTSITSLLWGGGGGRG